MVTEKVKKSLYLIFLPSQYEVSFEVATPQYKDINKMAVTLATSPADATTNYLFRTIKDHGLARRIAHALKDFPGFNACAFEFPEVYPEKGTYLSPQDVELCQAVALAEEIGNARKQSPQDFLNQSRQLLKMYRSHKETSQREH